MNKSGKRIRKGLFIGLLTLALAALTVTVIISSNRKGSPVKARGSEKPGPGENSTGKVYPVKKVHATKEKVDAEITSPTIPDTTGQSAELDSDTDIEKIIKNIRARIVEKKYDTMPLDDLFRALCETSGPSRRVVSLAFLFRKEESLGFIRDILRSGDPDEKNRALLLLQKYCRWEEAAPEVISVLKDSSNDDNLRLRASAAAAILGSSEAAPLIIRYYKETDSPQAREVSMISLGYLGGSEANIALRQACENGPGKVNLRAAHSLAKLGDDYGAEILLNALEDDNWATRMCGVEGLGFIGNGETRSVLEELEKRESSYSVKSAIRAAMAKMKAKNLPPESRLDFYTKCLDSRNEQSRLWAAEVIYENYSRRAAAIFADKYKTAKGPWVGALEMYLLWLAIE